MLLTIDFETRWDSKEYTLSKLTTEEYIRDEKFLAFGACIHEYGTDAITQWYGGDELHRILSTYDWTKTAVLAHNAQFDIAILEWVYGVHPCFIFDSLSMARALRGVEVGNSLAKLASDFGLPPKGRAVHSTDGLVDTTPEIEKELAEYCKHDVFLCEEIFKRLVSGYPAKELRLIDLTLRMYTRPLLELDEDMLFNALHEEREAREALLERLKITDADLASNDRFAELLRNVGTEPPTKKKKPTVKTPSPVGENYAFAKTDAMFQAMLNGSNDDVRLLCEARLKVKSTSERTRAQRFLDIAGRGTLPVPLSYYGAATGRWTASRGSAINMQNLKRGSFLRKAIMAPENHVCVVGDLSQIEPRVLAWLADYDDLLHIFNAGGDPYAMFGSQMFSIPDMTKESNPVERQSAKSALLGCFGSQTPVLTDRGWVIISEVHQGDRLWDGVEWVTHQGLVPQGEKEVLTAHGISATSDHEILTERGWVEWSAVLAAPSLFQSALSLANLPVLGGNDKERCTTHTCGAPAGGKDSCTVPTSSTGAVHAVELAHARKPSKLGGKTKATTLFARIESTVTDCLTVSAPSSSGVLTRTAAATRTTAGAVSRYILRGLKTALSSCVTLCPSMAGISLRYSLIGLTTTRGTNPAIFASSPAASTWGTSEKSPHAKSSNLSAGSQHLKQRMQTYDIAYAGPRNRYTVLTDAGPLIVHNCGYQLGWASFSAQLLVGFLGAPPKRYTKQEAKQLGVTGDYIERFLEWDDNVIKMNEIPHTCTAQELLIHCVAAKKIVDMYRATAHPVVGFWEMCQNLIQRSLADGEEYKHKCLLFRKEEIVLPNGMSLQYPSLRQQKDKESGRSQWVYGPDATKLYAGKITNNVTQATARIVMTDGMLRVAKRYPVVGTVHDEQIVIAPEREAKEALKWVLEQMTLEPSYMPGIPLAADGGFHRRYGLAKQ
jgi:hypothetical protein